ncbi:MarR family transcriptional regulator [Streptomyces sp. B1866]|uniref:MarR family winged helix-turn-helix transcriptional regulator n=1 Tax=Streptomyces sp. B1866 TaxID=3075431 RepID=UPI00288FD916|nr:MarR family transcriptional regulator [Streptomyces sp. B1866]MDT3396288.1 MarR family transcriptional regulator [Streptomyces sp. B1866]
MPDEPRGGDTATAATPATDPATGAAEAAGGSPGRTLAHGWCALSSLHGRIESHIERALQSRHGLSVREFSVLDVLSHQHGGPGGHLMMNRLAAFVILSQSATTRLVTRLEDRGLLARYLCPDDRRGIYTDVTPEGLKLLEEARPTNEAALREALAEAAKRPELAPLVAAVEALEADRPARPAGLTAPDGSR